jgi:polysaccharide biosynthesis transport protein
MNEKPVAPSFKLDDVYHVLFRHKWTILAIWVLTGAVAFGLWVKWSVPYQSEAKLFIRYIEDSKTIGTASSDSNIKTPDTGILGIINSETEILTSFDVAEQVTDEIGAANILAKAGGGSDRLHAAAVVRAGLAVDTPERSAVMRITFKHPDPGIVQNVLTHVVDTYLKKHAEIHQTMGTMDDYVTQTTDQLKSQLDATERQLRTEKSKAGVTSLDDTKRTLAEQRAKIQEDLDSALADLAQREAQVQELTNSISENIKSNSPAIVVAEVPIDKREDYRQICTLLEELRKTEKERLMSYLPESSRVQEIRSRIAANQKAKSEIERDYPQLLNAPPAEDDKPAIASSMPNERDSLNALRARVSFLTNRVAEVQANIVTVDNAEVKITDLQRKRDLQDQYYRNFLDKLQRDQINDSQTGDKMGNIKLIQAPSPPFKDASRLLKLIKMVLFGGFAGGVGIAFVIEFYLDGSFKRPLEVEAVLGLPLFMSIPKTNFKGRIRQSHTKLLASFRERERASNEENLPSVTNEVVPIKAVRRLQPYFEALRDRLITYFEVKKLTHKPKLVAVTGCGRGAGVTTVASGLAASLSETGDGNVLLVDMHAERAAHHFRHGQLEHSLDDALELEKRDAALVQENLYVVAESTNADNMPRILHKRLSALMPKLKASDYDYIIFDMPPVSQTSPTPRLARFMDIVVMVIEAEKTDRQVAKRASALLMESNANLGVVWNKNLKYVPHRLQQDL